MMTDFKPLQIVGCDTAIQPDAEFPVWGISDPVVSDGHSHYLLHCNELQPVPKTGWQELPKPVQAFRDTTVMWFKVAFHPKFGCIFGEWEVQHLRDGIGAIVIDKLIVYDILAGVRARSLGQCMEKLQTHFHHPRAEPLALAEAEELARLAVHFSEENDKIPLQYLLMVLRLREEPQKFSKFVNSLPMVEAQRERLLAESRQREAALTRM